MSTPRTRSRVFVSVGRGAFARPPFAERPVSPPPSYGVPTEGGELMPWWFVTEQLERARNYWVVTVGRREMPHSAPVWGVFVSDDLFFETSPTTRKGAQPGALPGGGCAHREWRRCRDRRRSGQALQPDPRGGRTDRSDLRTQVRRISARSGRVDGRRALPSGAERRLRLARYANGDVLAIPLSLRRTFGGSHQLATSQPRDRSSRCHG
jgi:hypothetical protein